jgi:hypothetical protein
MIFPAFTNPDFASQHQDAIRQLMMREAPATNKPVAADDAPKPVRVPGKRYESKETVRAKRVAGDKAAILAMLAEKPMTLAQISKRVNLSLHATRSRVYALLEAKVIRKTVCQRTQCITVSRIGG